MADSGFDTVIVGGGLAGVSLFYELAQRGDRVLLLEADAQVAQGASFANGGMLTASMPDPWNGPGVARHLASSLFDPAAAMKLHLRQLPDLALWGLRFLRYSSPRRHQQAICANYALARYSVDQTRLLAEAILPAGMVTASGALKIFEDAGAFAAQKANAQTLAPRGLRFHALSPAEVVEIEPQLEGARGRIRNGLYFPDDMSGDANAFCRVLTEEAQRAGGEIRTGVTVVSLLRDGPKIVGVATLKDRVRARRVVIATGHGSPDLTKGTGVHLPIKPAKGYSVTIDVRGWNERPAIPVIDDAMHAAVTPLGDRLRVVGTAEFAGRNTAVNQARIDNLIALFGRLYPHLVPNLARAEALSWAGLRPMSADGIPMIGPTRLPGLWINSGHGHLGWTMAVGSARLLAAMIAGDPAPIDPAPYDPERRDAKKP